MKTYISAAIQFVNSNPASTLQFCEVGFGSGQSAVMMLATHPSIRVLSFDLFPDPVRADLDFTKGKTWPARDLFAQQRDAADFISARWPLRSERIAGDANVTVPAFAQRHSSSVKCDIISIDGLHTSPQVFYDILNMRQLARSGTHLWIDDMSRPSLRADLARAERAGIVRPPACTRDRKRHPVYGQHMFCTTRYV